MFIPNLYVHYCPDGNAISDFHLETAYSILLAEYENAERDLTRYYSTANIFERIRLGIVSGDLENTRVTFVFDYQYIYINEYGMIPDWPDGFCTINQDLAEKLLRESTTKKKQKRMQKMEPRTEYFKVVLNIGDCLWSGNSNDYFDPLTAGSVKAGWIIPYYVGPKVFPRNRGTMLFVFTDLEEAKQWCRHDSRAEIWQCNVHGNVVEPDWVTISTTEYKRFWYGDRELCSHKTSPIPFTVMVDSLTLVKRVY